jgi:hypothetical protein
LFKKPFDKQPSLNDGVPNLDRYDRDMGNLSEQGTPFIGQRTSFHMAYPTVERAYIKYTETDFGSDPRVGAHDFANGPGLACRNRSCERGGFNFEQDIMLMVSQGLETKAIDASCPGDEGSPKGRNKGRNCLMSIEGTITIKYREPIASSAKDGEAKV